MKRGSQSFQYLSFLIMQGSLQLGFWNFADLAHAREDLIPGSRYTSGAGAAMGDAYLPIGKDIGSGLFYNPANLGRLRGFQVEPLNFSLYLNGPLIDHFGPSSTGVTNLASYVPKLQANPGERQGVGYSYLAAVGFPGLAIGLLYQTEIAGVANSDGTISYRSNYQII